MGRVGRSSVKKNAVLNIIKTLSTIIFPLITFPYITRVLSVDSVGAFNFTASIISYCMLFAGLGVSNYGIREGSQYRDDEKKMTEFISEVFSLNMISTVIVYIVLFLLLAFVPRLSAYWLATVIMSTEIIFLTIGVNWVCNIYEDFTFIAIRTIAFQVFSLLATFMFVRSPADYYKYVIITVIASSGANLLNFFYIRKNYVKFRLYFGSRIKQHIKPVFIIFASVITITLYVNSDIIILGFLTNDYKVGLYSTAVKIYTVVKNMLVAILSVLVPRFSILFSNNQISDADKLFERVVKIITVLLFPVVVGLFMTGDDVIQLFASGKYAEAGSSLRVLSVGILFSIFAYLCTNCVLLPNKKEKIILYSSIVSALVNIVFNFIMIPSMGIIAAAITTVMAEAIIGVWGIIASKKYVTMKLLNRDVIKSVISCIGIIVVCILAGNIQNSIIRLLTQITVSCLVYFSMVTILRHSVICEYLGKIRTLRR